MSKTNSEQASTTRARALWGWRWTFIADEAGLEAAAELPLPKWVEEEAQQSAKYFAKRSHCRAMVGRSADSATKRAVAALRISLSLLANLRLAEGISGNNWREMVRALNAADAAGRFAARMNRVHTLVERELEGRQ